MEKILIAVKEVLWCMLTAGACVLILYPIDKQLYYTYYAENFFFIFLALTLFRYVLFFNSIPFFKPVWVRFLLFVFNINIFVYITSIERTLLSIVDDFNMQDFGFPKVIMYDSVKEALFSYLYKEIVFFSTATLVLIVVFQLRLLISYWQFSSKKLYDMSTETD